MSTTLRDTRLSENQVSHFNEQGYLQLDRLADVDEIAWVREIYDRLFADRVGWDRGQQFDLAGTDDPAAKPRLPQLMNPANYAPELEKAAFRRAALEIARQLLGPDAERGDEHAICKPATDGAATPWHQDEAYWDPAFSYDALSIWIPLQEATLINGCMQFIPGSHHGQILPHHSINHDVRVHGLETDEVDPRHAVAVPLAAGGCTIHHSRTLHYTGPNQSGAPRRAYILTFRKPPLPLAAPRDFPWLTARRAARQERAG
jgi:ectoine hydroxylase-related dioxygenase (phytanoyl-CoA dioxygenase family)